MSTYDEASNALSFISSDCSRDMWIEILMAIKSEFGDSGYDLAKTWSQESSLYEEKSFISSWESIKQEGGIKIGTLFYHAIHAGFNPTKNRAIKKFSNHVQSTEAKKLAEDDKVKKVEKANWVFDKIISEAVPSCINSTPELFLYLNNRGLDYKELPEDVLFHPQLTYKSNGKDAKYPAIISLFKNKENKVINIHRTYLSGEDGKILPGDAKKLCRPINDEGTTSGSAIKLAQPDGILFLAEGLETALAVWKETKIATWACTTAPLLKKIEVPSHVKKIFIMADKDRSLAGEKAALYLAQRLIGEGKEVRILLPEGEIKEGNKSIDWLDVYNMEKAA